MSILLKALKKSEAQRQVGKPPDIHAPVELPSDEKSGSTRWLPVGLLVVIAAVLGWYVWQQYVGPETGSTAVPEVVAEAGSSVTAKPEADGTGSDSEGERNSAAQPVAKVENKRPSRPPVSMIGVNSNKPPAVNSLNASGAQAATAEERRNRLNQSFAEFESDEPAVEADETSAPELAESDSPVERVIDLTELESASATAAEKIAQDQPPENEVRRRESRPDPRQVQAQREKERLEKEQLESKTGSDAIARKTGQTVGEPISFWQLPQNLRDNLPEFRITVLVYAENPEERFVLINGVRLLEKEELASGVVLDEIRREGAVFLFRNYRFLVKG